MKINDTKNTELRENRNQSDLIHMKLDKFFTMIQHWDQQIIAMKDLMDKKPGQAEECANRILSMQTQRDKVMEQHRKAAFELDEIFGRYLKILDYMALTPQKIKKMLDAKYGEAEKGKRVRPYPVSKEVIVID